MCLGGEAEGAGGGVEEGGTGEASDWTGQLTAKLSGDIGPLLLDSEKSAGDGVLGGVSMDGIGWSLKQADS